jgi:hypothetical protein
VIDGLTEGQILKAARKLRTEQLKQRRAERERMLAEKQIAQGVHGAVYLTFPRVSKVAQEALAKDCVMFLEASAADLKMALEWMVGFGFKYRTNFCWIKNDGPSDGWVRQMHTLVLVGGRGKVPAPAPGTQFPSVLEGDDAPQRVLERYYPNMPKFDGKAAA